MAEGSISSLLTNQLFPSLLPTYTAKRASLKHSRGVVIVSLLLLASGFLGPQNPSKESVEVQQRIEKLEKEILKLQIRLLEAEKKILELESRLHSTTPREDKSPFSPFVDNGDGTITDTRSGLMWQKSCKQEAVRFFEDVNGDDFFGQQDYTGTPHRGQPRIDAEACRVGGYSDWQLPTMEHLRSLHNSLGLMTSYRSSSGNDRRFAPFEWPGAEYWSQNETKKERLEAVETFNFETGESTVTSWWGWPKMHTRFVRRAPSIPAKK